MVRISIQEKGVAILLDGRFIFVNKKLAGQLRDELNKRLPYEEKIKVT